MSKDEKGHRLRSPKQQFQLVSGLNPFGLKPGKGQKWGGLARGAIGMSSEGCCLELTRVEQIFQSHKVREWSREKDLFILFHNSPHFISCLTQLVLEKAGQGHIGLAVRDYSF